MKATGAAAAGLVAGALGTPFIARPSRASGPVILVVADALRGDVVGKTVGGQEVTPNINRLARENLYFTNAYSAAPGTKFSMASIFSGLYPPGHGVEHPRFTLPDCTSLPRYLAGKGYSTIGVVANPFMAPEIAFDGSQRPMGFGFNAGFDRYRLMQATARDSGASAPRAAARLRFCADGSELNSTLFALARSLLRGGGAGGGFFAYVHYMDSHQPWVKASPIDGITGLLHTDAGEPAALVHAKDVHFMTSFDNFWESPQWLREADLRRLEAIYLEAAMYVDRCVGQLLDWLVSQGLYEDATIIFTSDHGDELMEHGYVGHSKNLFNTSLHVPLLIKRPGATHRTVEQRVSNAMILPTVTEWFGEKLPESTVGPLQAYAQDDSLGHGEVFASFFGRDKVIRSDGTSAMWHDGEHLFFADARGPLDLAPVEGSEKALVSLTKARYNSHRLAQAAGIARRFSTYAWQNPLAPLQDEAAQAMIVAGRMTPEEASARKSFGGFIPKDAREDLRSQTKIDEGSVDPELREELRSLGYLH